MGLQELPIEAQGLSSLKRLSPAPGQASGATCKYSPVSCQVKGMNQVRQLHARYGHYVRLERMRTFNTCGSCACAGSVCAGLL